MASNPIREHRIHTKNLAKELKWTHVYHWLVEQGYFPESYVLPPCFRVKDHPKQPKLFSSVTGTKLTLSVRECCKVHFPKTDLTDRNFGIIDPEHHNDISYHIARNWTKVVDCLVPNDSEVTCYSFPVPIDSNESGSVGRLRSGRFIYEFLTMHEEDMASLAYRYTHLVKADIKNFYPSIYKHSIAWAIHGKEFIRKGKNRNNYSFLGNRLDLLFQYSNDQKTNGIPIGPAVSDIVAEIIAAAVDRQLTKTVKKMGLKCEMVRFKDDYRILVKDRGRNYFPFLDGRNV